MHFILSVGSLAASKIIVMITSVMVVSLVTKNLPVVDQARYFLFTTTISSALAFVRLGVGRSMMRRLASAAACDRVTRLRRELPLALTTVSISGLLLSPLVVVLCLFFAEGTQYANNTEVWTHVSICSAGLILMALMQTLSDAARGIGSSLLAAVLDSPRGGAISGVLMLVSSYLFYATGEFTIMVLMATTVACLFIAVAFGVFVLLRKCQLAQDIPFTIDTSDISDIFRDGSRFWIMEIAASLLLFGDIWLSSIFLYPEGSAMYYTASQIAALVTFPVGILSVSAVPHIVEAYSRSEIREAERMTQAISSISLLVCAPCILLLWPFSSEAMQVLFNIKSPEGGMVLRLLLATKLFSVIAGPTSLCLSFLMRGWEPVVLSVGSASLLLITLSSFVNPNSASQFAVLVLVVSVIRNITEWSLCRYKLGILTHPSYRSAAAAFICCTKQFKSRMR